MWTDSQSGRHFFYFLIIDESSTKFWYCCAHAFLMHWFTYKSLSAQFFFSWNMGKYLHPVFDEFIGQLFSSVMSPQSSTPLQIQSGWIHTPLLHWSFFWQPKYNVYTVPLSNHSFSCSWIVRNMHVHLWKYMHHKSKRFNPKWIHFKVNFCYHYISRTYCMCYS